MGSYDNYLIFREIKNTNFQDIRNISNKLWDLKISVSSIVDIITSTINNVMICCL